MEKMFEQAARLKLRFPTAKGLLTVEDLWDLPLTSTTNRPNLDELALHFYKKVKESAEVVSFVEGTAKASPADEIAFEIVKYVIDVKKAENAEAAARAQKAQQKERIKQLLAEKQDSALASKSEDELRELLRTL